MSRYTAVLLAAIAIATFSGVSADHYCMKKDNSIINARCDWYNDKVELEYNETFKTVGWDTVTVTPLDMTNQWNAYHDAGYVEGYVTHKSIWAMYTNAIQQWEPTLQGQSAAWIDQHMGYIRGNAAQASINFWTQVDALMRQIDGLEEGYTAANTDPAKALNRTQMFWLSFQAEFDDLFTMFPNTKSSPPTLGSQSHCSGLIKLTDDDLFMSHVTWSNFNTMYRQFKTYNFQPTVSMSSYPGVIHSIDDWYMTSNRLTVQETTNLLYNNSLYQYVVPQSVSEFLRVMTANYLATNGQDWVTFAQTENSGTYNNQWMVVDMKLVKPYDTVMMNRIPDGTLWVYEQLPGKFGRAADVSSVLRMNKKWISYNIPYFPEVNEVSGNTMMCEKYGSYYCYSEYARPEIFNARAGNITDLAGMKTMIATMTTRTTCTRWCPTAQTAARSTPLCSPSLLVETWTPSMVLMA